ncbi:sensor histidine kinase [Acinetobacter equi]|uniref:histidine kinase n=1 Tax=Acinetobacter equi TaxID=1324350 RepID=A0A0N7GY69_9GAMM|nr:HAMP domain-containing sensor histidine kinase [Acinetobacter equi]ALH96683.1 histidine kinase [Acinetobacter equi]
MKLELLEIGAETEQLGVCERSLLLGVHSQDNRIADFLKFACEILGADKGFWVFESEPYGWHFSEDACHAFTTHSQKGFSDFFLDQQYIDISHPNYQTTSVFLRTLGIEHQRFIAIDLKNEGETVGYAVFFDDKSEPYVHRKLNAIIGFVQSLLSILSLQKENALLKEIYEQESALNFSKTKFFQVIAHDLRAPFHGLLGFSEVLAREREELDDGHIEEIANYLFDTAQSTYNLLESLLNWAMAEGGRFVCHPINFDLAQTGQIVVNVLGGFAVKKNIKLINDIQENTKVYADINMITSVIQNLVSNALKFTPIDGSGKVILRTEQDDEQVYVYIHDTGLGMSQLQISTLFEPKITFSVHGTSGEKGAGLGLVLCKRFVDLNLGSISVISKEGEGTIFKVGLPKEKSLHKSS